MATKLRLQRHGKKRYPYYYIVAADVREKRDGKYIERLGEYDPNTNPATINLDFDRALHWLQVGAQPTDTMRAILSYKGVLHKNHLLNGVKKGAFSEEEAEKRFASWLEEKEGKVRAKREGVVAAANAEMEETLKTEKAVAEKRSAELLAKQAAAAGVIAAAAAGEAEDAADIADEAEDLAEDAG